MQFKVGEVTHYYDKIGVAVVELTGPLSIGERIKIVSGEEVLEQEVTSMQQEHEKIESAKRGEIIGLKVDAPVKKHAQVYKIQPT